MKWHVLYFETANGRCPVKELIDSQKTRDQAKFLALIDFLQQKGPLLPRPYADLLEDGIHELRIRLSGNQMRVLYFFCYRKYIVLTHGFTKTTSRVPSAQIKKAKKYRTDFLNRYEESDLEKYYD